MQSEDPANIDGQPITQELILDSDNDSDNEVVEVLVPKRVFLEISDSEDDSDIEIIESAPQLNTGSVNALPGPLLSRNRHDSIFNGDIRKKSNDMENRTSVDPREQFGGDKADEFMSISMDLDVISSERSENGEFVEIEEDVVMEIDSDAAALRRAAKGKGKAENQCSHDDEVKCSEDCLNNTNNAQLEIDSIRSSGGINTPRDDNLSKTVDQEMIIDGDLSPQLPRTLVTRRRPKISKAAKREIQCILVPFQTEKDESSEEEEERKDLEERERIKDVKALKSREMANIGKLAFVKDDVKLTQYLDTQKELANYPQCHLASIAGQSWEGEFDDGTLRMMADRNGGRPPVPDPNDTLVFQAMVNACNIHHARVTIIPPTNGQPPYSPPFEFHYSNRVIYPNSAPLPLESSGCNCDPELGCSDSIDSTCACSAKQTRSNWSSKPDTTGRLARSNHFGFSYNSKGVILEECLEPDEVIFECNSNCSCGPSCRNRVVGHGSTIPISLYHHGALGWGCKITDVAEGEEKLKFSRGTPLGVYAGDMILASDIDDRNNNVYEKLNRNYIFDLDAWRMKEGPNSTHPDDAWRDTKSEAWAVDAFSRGNFTRFLNHACSGTNVFIRQIYIDDRDIVRPLYVFVLSKDALSGEVLNISYFNSEEIKRPTSEEGWAKYRAKAEKARNEVGQEHACYCGAELCRGVTFNPEGETDEKNEKDEKNEEKEEKS